MKNLYSLSLFLVVLFSMVSVLPTFAAEPDYFTLTNTGTTNATLYLKRAGGNNSNTLNIEWSINGGTWQDTRPYKYTNSTSISIPAGQTIRFRGRNVKNNVYQFNSAGSLTSMIYWYMYSQDSQFKASGDIMSLVAFDETSQTIKVEYPIGNGCFYSLFNYNSGSPSFTTLTDASELKLPSTPSNYCFVKMFDGCAKLTAVPTLSATTLGSYCYAYMFADCRALVNAPELSATDITKYCYYGMFSRCVSLKTAPTLPATTLQEGCYAYMFQNCSTLVNVQDTFPGTNLPKLCYQYMFDGCVDLKLAPEIMAAEDASVGQQCMDNMFANCTSLEKAPSVLRPKTLSGSSCVSHMFFKCTNLTKAPTIMATDITGGNAADYMFGYCSKLNYMRIYRISFPSSITGSNYWVTGVSQAGTIYCPPTLQRLWTQTYSKMPYSSDYPWTIFSYDVTFVPVDGKWADGTTANKRFTWETDTTDIHQFIAAQNAKNLVVGYYLSYSGGKLSSPTTEAAIKADLPVQQTESTKYVYVQLSGNNSNTITFTSSNTDYGTVTPTSITNVPRNTTISVDGTQVTIHGTTVTATPATNTAEYTYAFSGWTNTAGVVDGDRTITATFTRTKNQYAVLFKNGTTILQNTNVVYGEVPVYSGMTPTQESTFTHTYTFSGWSDGVTTYAATSTLPAVTGSATYTAMFEESDRFYTIHINAPEHGTLVVKDGNDKTLTDGAKVPYETALLVIATPAEGYQFAEWTDDGAESIIVDGSKDDITIGVSFTATAAYTLTINPTEGGLIEVTDGVHTYTEGSHTVYAGVSYTCRLIPDNQTNGWGWWIDEDYSIVSSELTRTIVPIANVNLYAGFGLNRVEIDGDHTVSSYETYQYQMIHELVYKRTFNAKTWATLWLPFSIDVAAQDMGNSLYTLANSVIEEQMAGLLDVALTFHKYGSGVISEGEPCLYYPKQKYTELIFHDVAMTTFEPTTIAVGTGNSRVEFIGVSEPTTIGGSTCESLAQKKSYRCLSNNVLYYPDLNNGAQLETFQSYFQITEYTYWYGEGGAGAPRLRIIVEDAEITESEEVEDNVELRKYINDEGMLILERNGVRYGANGELLRE